MKLPHHIPSLNEHIAIRDNEPGRWWLSGYSPSRRRTQPDAWFEATCCSDQVTRSTHPLKICVLVQALCIARRGIPGRYQATGRTSPQEDIMLRCVGSDLLSCSKWNQHHPWYLVISLDQLRAVLAWIEVLTGVTGRLQRTWVLCFWWLQWTASTTWSNWLGSRSVVVVFFFKFS